MRKEFDTAQGEIMTTGQGNIATLPEDSVEPIYNIILESQLDKHLS